MPSDGAPPGGKPLSRRELCLVGGAALVAACGRGGNGGGDGGSDMNVGAETHDLAGFFRTPDFTCLPKTASGPYTSFLPGTATFFPCQRLFICRDGAGIFALSGSCTHQGCNVEFDAGTTSFTCPCHQSTFDFNGAVTHDPATLPLVHYQVSLDGAGDVVVDPTVMVAATTRLVVPGD